MWSWQGILLIKSASTSIKSIFLSAAAERLSSRDSFLPQQYMQTSVFR